MNRLTGEYGTPGHLARRFARSLWPAGPGPAGEAWARRWLTAPEAAIWDRMSGPDRRHAVVVGHRVAAAAGNADGTAVPKPLIVAALLHDCGKVGSRLGTFGRVAATLVALTSGRSRLAAWSGRPPGWRRRAGMYAAHDEIGSNMLDEAGSDALVVAWAAEHHLPADRWTVDAGTGRMLKEADDD